MKNCNTIGRILWTLLLLGTLGGCRTLQRIWDFDFVDFPESRLENLERLHTATGKHRYSVRFTGDVEHAMSVSSKSFGGMRIGAPAAGPASRMQELADPSEKCLELLQELLSFNSEKSPRLEAVQVSWCARIIEEDPAVLSRERAVLALGKFAKRRGIKESATLRIDAPRASPKEAAKLLADLLGSWRRLRSGVGSPDEWEASLTALNTTVFDLSGYRRVLPTLASLLQGLNEKDPSYEGLLKSVHQTESLTIRLALGRALEVRVRGGSIVRAAAVHALAESGGSLAVAMLMPYLQAEREAGPDRDEFLVTELLASIAQIGYPDSIPQLSEEQYTEIREGWYALLVAMAVGDAEGRVRVKACQALARVTDGGTSLREEDWEDWLYDRTNALRAKAGLSQVPAVTDSVTAEAPQESGGS